MRGSVLVCVCECVCVCVCVCVCLCVCVCVCVCVRAAWPTSIMLLSYYIQRRINSNDLCLSLSLTRYQYF